MFNGAESGTWNCTDFNVCRYRRMEDEELKKRLEELDSMLADPRSEVHLDGLLVKLLKF